MFQDIECVQQAIEDIIREANTGQAKGIMFQILYDDGGHMTCTTTNLTYLEKLGLLESAKQDVAHKALYPPEPEQEDGERDDGG